MLPTQQKRSHIWYWKHCQIVMASEVMTLSQELLPLSRSGILPNCIPNPSPHRSRRSHHRRFSFLQVAIIKESHIWWKKQRTGACVVSVPMNNISITPKALRKYQRRQGRETVRARKPGHLLWRGTSWKSREATAMKLEQHGWKQGMSMWNREIPWGPAHRQSSICNQWLLIKAEFVFPGMRPFNWLYNTRFTPLNYTCKWH